MVYRKTSKLVKAPKSCFIIHYIILDNSRVKWEFCIHQIQNSILISWLSVHSIEDEIIYGILRSVSYTTYQTGLFIRYHLSVMIINNSSISPIVYRTLNNKNGIGPDRLSIENIDLIIVSDRWLTWASFWSQLSMKDRECVCEREVEKERKKEREREREGERRRER